MAHDRCMHDGEEVAVGSYIVRAGGLRLSVECLKTTDLLVTLCGKEPYACQELPRKPFEHLCVDLQDFSGVPEGWATTLNELIARLESGVVMTVHCAGGFGRTGTLIASLIAVLEPDVVDPIAKTRERYCPRAVETQLQAAAIFALKGEEMPSQYNSLMRGE